ncbi:MAG: hypothetical protein HRF47_19310 [Chloroflexota bacterium]|jgi:hypothetical protein
MSGDVQFDKPYTYRGTKTIQVSKFYPRWGWHVSVLEIERWAGEKTWRVVRPQKSAAWNVRGEIVIPAKPRLVFAEGLTLPQARQKALEVLEQTPLEDLL